MLKAILKTYRIETRVVWVGVYGGHYDQIVFFKEKPKLTPKSESYSPAIHFPDAYDGYYDCHDNKELIIGDMSIGNFNDAFNCDLSSILSENGRPKSIEIIEVFQMEITTKFDEDGCMSFHHDWD